MILQKDGHEQAYVARKKNKFSVHVTCGYGSVLFLRRCNMLILYSGFVDDVMLSFNTDT